MIEVLTIIFIVFVIAKFAFSRAKHPSISVPKVSPVEKQTLSTKACSKCEATIDMNTAFCPACGTKVGSSQKCTSCDAELEIGQNFCAKCGSPVT
jgi:RNA polymerase subunit RPABC4/transcription elongation factor Spt4